MVAVCQGHQDLQVPRENQESLDGPEHLEHQVYPESHPSHHVTSQRLHHASHAQLDLQDPLDHQEIMANPVPLALLVSPAPTPHQANLAPRDHPDPQASPAATDHQAIPALQPPTSPWNPEIQDPQEMLDPQVLLDLQDHLDPTVCPGHQVLRDPKDHLDNRDPTDSQVCQDLQATQEQREKRVSVPSTAPWTVESSLKMAPGDKARDSAANQRLSAPN
jgi:hypothetical protein